MTGSPVGFWSSTPRTLANAVQGALNRARTDHRARAWAAWMTAALGRAKEMPSFDEIAGPDEADDAKPQQTPAQHLAILTAWAARNAE